MWVRDSFMARGASLTLGAALWVQAWLEGEIRTWLGSQHPPGSSRLSMTPFPVPTASAAIRHRHGSQTQMQAPPAHLKPSADTQSVKREPT